MKLNIQANPLPYVQRLERREAVNISLVVIHCTELPDLASARLWGEKVLYTDSNTGNSGHFYIDRDGSIEEWVPVNHIAHHVRGFNSKSIGIELVNRGRYPGWFQSDQQQMSDPYPGVQIKALTTLLNHLVAELPGLVSIAGHEDLDTGMQPSEDKPDIMIRRKLDPGPQFPWADFMAAIMIERLTVNDR